MSAEFQLRGSTSGSSAPLLFWGECETAHYKKIVFLLICKCGLLNSPQLLALNLFYFEIPNLHWIWAETNPRPHSSDGSSFISFSSLQPQEEEVQFVHSNDHSSHKYVIVSFHLWVYMLSCVLFSLVSPSRVQPGNCKCSLVSVCAGPVQLNNGQVKPSTPVRTCDVCFQAVWQWKSFHSHVSDFAIDCSVL